MKLKALLLAGASALIAIAKIAIQAWRRRQKRCMRESDPWKPQR